MAFTKNKTFGPKKAWPKTEAENFSLAPLHVALVQ